MPIVSCYIGWKAAVEVGSGIGVDICDQAVDVIKCKVRSGISAGHERLKWCLILTGIVNLCVEVERIGLHTLYTAFRVLVYSLICSAMAVRLDGLLGQ